MGVLERLRQALESPVDTRDRVEADRLRQEVVGHYEAGRYHEAAAAARRLLDLQKKALGARHPEFAAGLINLAMLLEKQSDLAGAEPLLVEALGIRRDVLGPRHPDSEALARRLTFLRKDRERAEAGSAPLPAPKTPANDPTPSPPGSPAEDETQAPTDGRGAATPEALSRELAALAEAFVGLGDRLARASRVLSSRGAPPPEGLIEEMRDRRREFATLCDRARRRAALLPLNNGAFEGLPNLESVGTLLGAIAEAETRRAESEETRRRALGVLDRVLQLAHTESSSDRALEGCQSGARSLRGLIAEAGWLDLPAEAGPLAAGRHPLACLVALIDDRGTMGDERWMTLYKAIRDALGPALAAAAARSRLVATGPPDRIARTACSS